MKKRILTFLSMFVLVGINIWADDNLASLVSNASSGGTITLTQDETLTSTVTINKNLTIDLKGHSITATNCRAFHITAGEVNFINTGGVTKSISSVVDNSNNANDFPNTSSVIRIGDNSGDARNVSLTIDKNVGVKTDYCYGVTVFGSKTNETLTVNGAVSVTGVSAAISGNGSKDFWNTTTVINIGKTAEIKSTQTSAIYHPHNGTLNFYGTIAEGSNGGIEAKSGTINIYEGAVIYGAATQNHTACNNDPSTKGYAIAVVGNNNYAGDATVNINGGTFHNAIAILDDQTNVDASKKGSIAISGGTFYNCGLQNSYLASGCSAFTGKSYVTVGKAAVASITESNTTYQYATLESAINDYTSGSTLKLLNNVSLTSTITINKDLVLDLAGKSITATNCRAFHVTAGDVKFTNTGTLNYISSTTDSNNNKSVFPSTSSVIRVGDGGTTKDNIDNKTAVALTIDKNVGVKTDYCYGVTVFGSKTTETLTVDGIVDVTGEQSAIAGNGLPCHAGTTIKINEGAQIASKNDNAIYHPQAGTLDFAGIIPSTSNGGIEAKSGTINIKEGAEISRNAQTNHQANGDGCSTKGYAVVVVQNNSYAGKATVNIEDGTFDGAIAIVDDQQNVDEAKAGKIAITKGTFYNSGLEGTNFLASGSTLYKGNKVVTVGTASVATVTANNTSTQYATIEAAMNSNEWVSGSTLQLTSDVSTTTSRQVSENDLILDLNGHKWENTSNDVPAFRVLNKKAKLTINDSKPNSTTGSIVSDTEYGVAVMLGDATISKNPEVDSATVVVNGGKLDARDYAICGNGTYYHTNIIINDGELKGKTAIYHPQLNSTLTINNGKLTGSETALEVRAADQVTITGGTLECTADKEEVVQNGSGTTTIGYALSIAQHTTTQPINVKITGGTFTGLNALGVLNPQGNKTDNVKVSINGDKCVFKATAKEAQTVAAAAEGQDASTETETTTIGGKALYMAHKGATLNVLDGKFSGKIESSTDANMNLIGGYYTVKPNSKDIANGFKAATPSTTGTGYDYQVTSQITLPTGDSSGATTTSTTTVATVDDDVAISGGSDTASEPTETERKAVTEAVTENTAVTTDTPNTGDAIKTDTDSDVLNDLIAAAVEAGAITESSTSGGDTTGGGTGETGTSTSTTSKTAADVKVVTSLSINLKKASVSTTGDAGSTQTTTVTKMVFDIKPVATAFVDSKPVASVTVPNEQITKKIKFRLPVDKSIETGRYIEVTHTPDGSNTEEKLGLFQVLSTATTANNTGDNTVSSSGSVTNTDDGDKYIEIERKGFSEYACTVSNIAANSAKEMTIYRAGLEESKSFIESSTWEKVLKETPNALAIIPYSDVNQKFVVPETDNANNTKTLQNVIIEYSANGTDDKIYKCPKLVLTDKKEFYAPVKFTATAGSYTRTTNSLAETNNAENQEVANTGTAQSYNSVCLPFAIKASDFGENAKLLLFSIYNPDKKVVGFTSTTEVPAGTPCIVLADNNLQREIKFENTEICCEPNNSGNMKGTFTLTSEYGKDPNYLSVNNQNMFQKLADKLYPFRSCLYLKTTNETGVNNAPMNIVILDEEATGIKNVVNKTISDGTFYSINGVKMGTSFDKLPKGIYLFNGKKIVKN